MERGALAGAKSWWAFLGRTIMFPLAWAWALGIARRHEESDGRGRSKVLTAIVVGVVLAAGGGYLLYDFQEDARVKMYEQTDGRIAVALGESAYQEQWTIINASETALGIQRTRLAEAEAQAENDSLPPETRDIAARNAIKFSASIINVTTDRDAAVAARDDLQENHEFYLRVKPWIAQQDDDRVLGAIRAADFETSEATQVRWPADRMVPRSEAAFRINAEAQDGMWQAMAFMLLPGLIGVFYAPMFFALGSIMLRAWEPSDTVGFKPYPGRALGWFLLLGGFGWPALIFSAWGFRDIDMRSREGQIAL